MKDDFYKNKKLLFITHGYYQGGASTSLAHTIQWVEDNKIKFKIISTRKQEEKTLKIRTKKGAQFCTTFSHPSIVDHEGIITPFLSIVLLLIFQKLKINPYLINFIKEYNPEFIIFNSTHHCWMIPILKKIFSKTKIIFFVREQVRKERSLAGLLNYNWLKHADKLLCISEFESNLLHNSNKYVIYNTIGKNYEYKNKMLFKKNATDYKIIQMGQPSFCKGGHVLIYAMREVIRKKRTAKSFDAILLGAGSKGIFKKGNFAFFIKTLLFLNTKYFYSFLINIFKLRKHIKITDYIMDVKPYLEDSDIYIRTSLSGDSWGRDIIEAMSLGLLCIGSGESPFIEDGISGFLYKANDSKALEKVLRKISEMKKSELRKIAKNGQKRIKEMCSYQTFENSLNKNFFNIN